MTGRFSYAIVLINAHHPLFAWISNLFRLPNYIFGLCNTIQTLTQLVPLNCSHYSICTQTSIPCMDQHFQGPADQFSRNFGLMFSNQNFHQTKISMKVPIMKHLPKLCSLHCAVTYFEHRVLCWNFFTYQSYPRFTSNTNCSCWSKCVIKCLMIWATLKNNKVSIYDKAINP